MDWTWWSRAVFRRHHVVFGDAVAFDIEYADGEGWNINESQSPHALVDALGGAVRGRVCPRGRVVNRRVARHPLHFLVAGLSLAGCATMFELDGYDDAVTLLCQCPGFESIADCVGNANKRLAFATVTERQTWLDEYQAKECGTLCEHADECYSAVPPCREKRAGCECCAWNGGQLSCTDGTCATCRTCPEIITKPGDGNDCVSSRARYRELRTCGCSQCSSQCAGFCQGTSGLSANGSDMCSKCLAGACSDLLTACKADK